MSMYSTVLQYKYVRVLEYSTYQTAGINREVVHVTHAILSSPIALPQALQRTIPSVLAKNNQGQLIDNIK